MNRTEDIINELQRSIEAESEPLLSYADRECIIEAMEKQVPMKPIERIMFYFCPHCGDPVVITDFETDIFMGCCINCGQKLDWSDKA